MNLMEILFRFFVVLALDETGAIKTSALVSAAPTATGIEKRTVSDTIRHLFPGFPTMSLVQSGMVGTDITKSKNLIKKRGVDNVKFENFNYSPLAITLSITTYTDATSIIVADATALTPKMCVIDTQNKTVARISAISGSTLTLTSIGDTAFSSAVNKTLLILAPVYADNSSNPFILMKTEDNLYNILEVNRFPSAISASNKGNPFFGKDFWQRVRKQVVMEGFRKVENSAIFSERASGTNLTTTDSTIGDSVRTTRGLWWWSKGGGASFNAGGNMTHEKFIRDFSLAMNDTVGSQDKIIGYVSRDSFADMVQWSNEKLMVMQSGTLEKFGVKSKVFITSGPEIEIIVHDAFNQGSNKTSAIFYNPDHVEYVFKKGRDFHPVMGIQGNDVDGVEDDFLGEWGIGVDDGGSTITRIEDW